MKYLGNIFFGFILGLAAMFLMGRGCKHKNAEHVAEVAKRQETSVIANIVAHRFDSVSYYRDKLGQEHANRVLIQGDAAAIRIFYKKREDSICEVLHLRNSQIKDMLDVTSEVTGSFTTPTLPVQTQTVGEQDSPMINRGCVYQFSYSDDFLQEYGLVDSVRTEIHYHMEIPVSINTYWTRRWFLGGKHYFIDGYSTNVNVHITGLTGISINSKK